MPQDGQEVRTSFFDGILKPARALALTAIMATGIGVALDGLPGPQSTEPGIETPALRDATVQAQSFIQQYEHTPSMTDLWLEEAKRHDKDVNHRLSYQGLASKLYDVTFAVGGKYVTDDFGD